MRVDDVAGNGPGIYCLPRRRMPFHSRDKASECVSMTWRAMSARPSTKVSDGRLEQIKVCRCMLTLSNPS